MLSDATLSRLTGRIVFRGGTEDMIQIDVDAETLEGVKRRIGRRNPCRSRKSHPSGFAR